MTKVAGGVWVKVRNGLAKFHTHVTEITLRGHLPHLGSLVYSV